MIKKYIKDILYSLLATVLIISSYVAYDGYFIAKLHKEMLSLHYEYHHFTKKEILIKKYSKIAYFEKVIYIMPEFWLSYISLLLDEEDLTKAKEVLKSHANILKNEEIQNYLKICSFAVSMGMKDKKIEESAAIFEKFEESYKNKTLYKLLKDKTVAVVGNGPFELGKKSGKEIDAHDIVIRMNNYVIDGFEEDYGKRTDVWIYGFGGPDIQDKTLDNEYLYVGMTGDYRYLPLLYNFQQGRLYRDMIKRKINIGTVEPNIYRKSRYEYGFEPSTGFTIIYTLKKWKIDFDVYGFSFLEKETQSTDYHNHYFPHKKASEVVPQPHPVARESEILSKWFDNRHIKKLRGNKNE